eukprot:7667728-Ditylum_brightwellii.AAC.1
MLYTIDGSGNKRDLSTRPFANIALYLAGGDKVARSLMVSNGEDAKRLHLIDAPKSLVSSLKTKAGPAEGEDGGERIRDIVPKAGTLVMFDSVSLPHEVLMTNRERFGVQDWRERENKEASKGFFLEHETKNEMYSKAINM